jgi:radical SAM protein with 4Fe4S-binding SPASM domain
MNQQRKPGPPVVGWEITSCCNLTCPHCFSAAAKRPYNEVPTEDCKRIIDAMARIGVGMIGWTGGEPLLREDLEELIAYAKQLGIKSSITTNGVLLDEKRAISLKQAGNRVMQISLDGSTPEISYKMRRTTDEEFYKIVKAIKICRRLNMRLFLATLIGEENLDDAAEMIKMAKREGLDTIRFCGFTPVGRGKRKDVKERLDFDERLGDLLTFIENTQKDPEIMSMYDPGFGPTPPGYTFHECVAGKETFYLKASGDVYPCTSLLHRDFVVGNIHKRPLEEIWNDPAMEEIANRPPENIHGPCRDCDNFVRCHGACRGAAFAHTGDFYASFPVCLYQVAWKIAVG